MADFADQDRLGAANGGQIQQDTQMAGQAKTPWVRQSMPIHY